MWKSGLFQHSTGIYFGQFLLCVLWKITLHHPIIILGFRFEYIRNRPTLKFTEIKNFNTVFHHESSGKIHNHVFSDSLNNGINRIAQRRVALSLRLQYFVSS